MTPKRARWRVGDVFTVPIDDERIGYGQIVATWGDSGSHFYFLFFDAVYSSNEEPDLDEVVGRPVASLGLSMDALLRHKRWRVVGRRDVPSGSLRWPAYKESVAPEAFDVVDHTGEVRRRASNDEAERLPYREVVAPIRLENAFRALYDAGEWNDAYETLLPVTEDATSAALLSDA
jgi:hypothetical protein